MENNATRLENEYALLEAMYPGQVTYAPKSKEIHYQDTSASLLIRLPDSYPEEDGPQIISATNSGKSDLRDTLKQAIASLPIGEEALDTVINAFQEVLAAAESGGGQRNDLAQQPSTTSPEAHAKKLTTIVWLHHLLNTNKRKLVLAPSDEMVSGISKPGYPGVLIFAGPASGVQEHVNVLKQQNWAAFQIRYEHDIEWTFGHGHGVKEVETMGEVVKDIGDRKDDFLEAMRMR